MNTGTDYTAFIDLLGSKESANVHAGSFKEGIDRFTDVVTSTALELDDSSRVHLFSDCAFISFKNFAAFVEYIVNVRYQLFSANYYFKCAVVPGRLSATLWQPARLQAKERDRLRKRVTGTTFGASSVDAFLLQERFKGVGITVDARINHPDLTVETIFFKGDDVRGVSTAQDIRYSKKETGGLYSGADEAGHGDCADADQAEAEEYIRAILSSVVSAKTKQKGYGKYYMSTIISLIKSSDFTKVFYDDTNRWTHYPILFRHLFVNNFVERKLNDMMGWEFCYLAAVGAFFNQQNAVRPSRTQEALVYEIAKRPKVARKISVAPPCIIGRAHREQLLREIAAFTTKGLIGKQ